MDQAPTIQEVIKQVAVLVGEVSTLSTVISVGATEFIKKFTSNSKVIAGFVILFGFLAGLTVMKLFNGAFFSPLSLLVAGISSLAPAGVYSLSTTLVKKSSTQ